MRVLLVKMSSLGDVVHALPAVTDAAAAVDGVEFDWVVEEAFAAIPARHPAVAEVVPVGWRRWRRRLSRHGRDLGAFVRRVRARRYDLVLDAQGLVKSAAVTALARGGIKAGFARGSAREGAAALAYGRRLAVPRDLHAVDRLRRLFAAALGYPCPDTPPRFGIAPAPGAAAGGARCLLLHGTTWKSKEWPLPFWRELARQAGGAGFDVVVPWGGEEERVRAGQIAAQSPARVLEPKPLEAMIGELAGASLVIGVDSGLAHLAAALDVPTLTLYGSTSSALTGCRGMRARNLQASFPCAPCLRRECGYAGPAQIRQGETVSPACYVDLPPERVWQAARELVDADRVLHL